MLVVLALAVTGCAHARPARPAGPAAVTQAVVAEAEAALRRRAHDEARAAYERAVATAPDRVSEGYARKELARALVIWDERAAAATQLERVTALAPGDAAAWHDLGIVRHAEGDVAGARAALGEAKRLAPRDARPRLALAALAWASGDRAGALAEYRALEAVELPARVREKVRWAIEELERELRGGERE